MAIPRGARPGPWGTPNRAAGLPPFPKNGRGHEAHSIFDGARGFGGSTASGPRPNRPLSPQDPYLQAPHRGGSVGGSKRLFVLELFWGHRTARQLEFQQIDVEGIGRDAVGVVPEGGADQLDHGLVLQRVPVP